MFLHAERFATQPEAEKRYRSISDALRESPKLDCAVFNIGLGDNPEECTDHIVAIVSDREVPYRVLQVGVAGEPYNLTFQAWQALILHHYHARSVITEEGWTRFNFNDKSVELLPDGTIDGASVKELYEHTDREHTP